MMNSPVTAYLKDITVGPVCYAKQYSTCNVIFLGREPLSW